MPNRSYSRAISTVYGQCGFGCQFNKDTFGNFNRQEQKQNYTIYLGKVISTSKDIVISSL